MAGCAGARRRMLALEGRVVSDTKTCFRCGKIIKDERAWMVYHGSKFEYECFDCSPMSPHHTELSETGNLKKCSKCGLEIQTGQGWFLVSEGYMCGSCNYLQSIGQLQSNLKPTLGVTPYSIWLEKRIVELAKAIESRSAQLAANPLQADESPLGEWAIEIMRLRLRLKKGEV